MNSKLILCLTSFLLICNSTRLSDSYIILEPEKSDQILINSVFERNQLETNALSEERGLTSDKFSENRTSYANQTHSQNGPSLWLKHHPMSAKRTTNQRLKSCQSCSKDKQSVNPEEEYIQRLEYIKYQILSKLGLSHAPKLLQKNVDSYSYLQLLEVSSLALNSAQPPEQAKEVLPKDSDKLFIFANTKRQNVPQFNISVAKHSFESIQKITLYVKQSSSQLSPDIDTNSIDNELVVISTAVPVNGEVLSRFQDISNMRVLGIVDPQSDRSNGNERQLVPNWLHYDLTLILRPEVVNDNKLISFDSSSLDLRDAFITVEHYNQQLLRSKRSIDCSGNTTSCCRESFYVNFTNIGWDNWIVQPPGYTANYCKGKCDISNARYHHTTVIGRYPAINMCCSPREMSHISLIYLDDNNNVFQKNLANMVVESCDCA